MTERQSRSALLGGMLALLALFGLAILSGWHSAAFGDHAPAHAASLEHSHDRSGQDDSSSPIHLAAHSSGQWLAASGHMFFPTTPVSIARAWTTIPSVPGGGFDPSSLLRPPRA